MQQASYRSTRSAAPGQAEDRFRLLIMARIMAGELIALASLASTLAAALLLAAVVLPG